MVPVLPNLAVAVHRFPALRKQVEQRGAAVVVSSLETGSQRGNPQDEADALRHLGYLGQGSDPLKVQPFLAAAVSHVRLSLSPKIGCGAQIHDSLGACLLRLKFACLLLWFAQAAPERAAS